MLGRAAPCVKSKNFLRIRANATKRERNWRLAVWGSHSKLPVAPADAGLGVRFLGDPLGFGLINAR